MQKWYIFFYILQKNNQNEVSTQNDGRLELGDNFGYTLDHNFRDETRTTLVLTERLFHRQTKKLYIFWL